MIRSKILSYKLILYSVFFLLMVLGVSTEANAIDNDFLKGRAIQIANFSPDELVVEPKIIFNLIPGGNRVEQETPNKRVINLVNPKFAPGITAVFEAPKYKIVDQTRTYTLYSFKRRVGDILSAGGVDLAKEDIVTPPVDATAFSSGNLIKITRVSIAEVEKFEVLPYQTKKIDDPSLERGKEKVENSGKLGKKLLLYQVRRENGVEISRKLIKEEILEKAENKIIKVGTKVVVLSSVSGFATATNRSNAVVSANYRRGTLIRITNLANGVTIEKTVNYTWGIASPPDGIVLDLSWSILDELRFNGDGKGPRVLVEEIKQ